MIRYFTITIKNALNCDNIYTYLKRNGYSENYLKNLRKTLGYILLNDKEVFITEKISNGDILKINSNPNNKSEINSCFIPLNVLYEDDYILAVYKPSGLATMPTRSHFSYNLSGAVAYYMQEKDPNFVVRIINRLDKDTAGIVIVAKDSITSNMLNNSDFILKTYYALLSGKVTEDTTISKKIDTVKNEDGINLKTRIANDFGKTAKTFISPIKYFNNNDYTFCKITIEHGRTHQIRVHSAYIKHALLGDELYGNSSNLINHTALVCKTIKFVHPYSKKEIIIDSELPDDFKNLINL